MIGILSQFFYILLRRSEVGKAGFKQTSKSLCSRTDHGIIYDYSEVLGVKNQV